MITTTANAPEIITKELGINRNHGGPRIRLSTNFLPLLGFEANSRFVCESLGQNKGMVLKYEPNGTHKVHTRQYKSRKANPFETVIELTNKSLIGASIADYIERAHFTMRRGEILIKPLANRTFMIRKHLKDHDNPFSSFVGMTAGVDCHCLESLGFKVDGVLEYRPQEARDIDKDKDTGIPLLNKHGYIKQRDRTETGAINVLGNCSPRVLINESIFDVDWNYVQELMDVPAIGMLHMSPQCDDFSNGKADSLKEKSVDSLDTTKDMFYDCIRAVETLKPATVMVENVDKFANSPACEYMKIRLRRMGYHLTEGIFLATDYGCITTRKRYYLVASVWPDFEMPEMTGNNPVKAWDLVLKHWSDLRDITDTLTPAQAVEVGRDRRVKEGAAFAGTVMKSQSRQAKDTVVVEHEGRIYMPSNQLLRELMGFPDSLRISSTKELETEIIGQSIEYPLHHKIAQAVYDHIALNTGHCTITKFSKEMKTQPVFHQQSDVVGPEPDSIDEQLPKAGQMSLF